MKRKTNLFYTSGPDSKFLTFSNYTEALTGNFLSINTKLFPDKFLCLKINNLNANTKANFIKYLSAYYENKLATLRDDLVNKDKNIESIYPLSYLLEAITKVVSYNNGEYTLNENCEVNTEDNNDSIEGLIRYIGDVTEYDYNGSYTDIICNINTNQYYEGIIKPYSSDNVLTCTTSEINKLYGWENDNMTLSEYADVTPIFDSEHTYSYNPKYSRIEYKKINEESSSKTLSFNVIIPLFSYINVDKESNINILDPKIDENDVQYLDIVNNYNSIYDVPFGIWIYADFENDTFIDLIKDVELNLYPSWSLLISTQFKPFPYSNILNKDNDTSKSSLNEFSTFAEVLSKMNNVLNKFGDISYNINALNERINSLETKINNIATDSRMDSFDNRLLQMDSELKAEITAIKQSLINLKWSSVG